MFNDVKINRFAEDGTLDKVIDVPIISHYNKNFAQFIRNTSRVKESQFQIPVMGLRITGLNRDTPRTTQQNYIRKVYDKDSDQYLRDRRPSTWKLSFTLGVYTENLIDFSQIIENIVTYFDPTLTVSIKEFEKVNIERDIIVTLEDGVPFDFEDEVDRQQIQSYSTELKITAAVVLYPPISAASIIKHINKNILVDNRVVGTVKDDGYHPANINDYNKQLGEIVEIGNLPDSYTVNKIIESNSNYIKIEINQSSNIKELLANVPGGSTIVYVEIIVHEMFNSLNSTISIGTEYNNEKYMKINENNLYFAAKYAISFENKIYTDEEINVYFNRGSATNGTAFVTVAWN